MHTHTPTGSKRREGGGGGGGREKLKERQRQPVGLSGGRYNLEGKREVELSSRREDTPTRHLIEKNPQQNPEEKNLTHSVRSFETCSSWHAKQALRGHLAQNTTVRPSFGSLGGWWQTKQCRTCMCRTCSKDAQGVVRKRTRRAGKEMNEMSETQTKGKRWFFSSSTKTHTAVVNHLM